MKHEEYYPECYYGTAEPLGLCTMRKKRGFLSVEDNTAGYRDVKIQP